MKNHSWDNARKKTIYRRNPHTRKMEALENDVNFFVLALESVGARCRYSCAGHPFGFYVDFVTTSKIAFDIAKAGFFTVELGNIKNEYIIRLSSNEQGHEAQFGEPWNDEVKYQCLRWAAERWIDILLRPRRTSLALDAATAARLPSLFSAEVINPVKGQGATRRAQ